MAKAKKAKKRSAPPKQARQTLRRILDARKKADQALEQAHMKVFAAKLIVMIAKEAGIQPPSMAVRKAVIERGKAKAAAAKLRAQNRVAAARAARACARSLPSLNVTTIIAIAVG